MPVPTETLWNTKRVSIVFACSSIALLASIIWMVKVDYAKPWRDIQNNFVDLQASLAHFEVLGTQTPESLEELANAQAAVEIAKKKVDAQQTQIATLTKTIRDGIKPDDADSINQITALITGPDRSAYEARARDIDPQFSEALQKTSDAEALKTELANPDFAEKMADLLDWFHLQKLDERDKQIRGKYARSELVFKNLKSERGVLAAAYEHEKGLYGEKDLRALEAQDHLKHLDEKFEAAKVRYERLADERKLIESQIKLIKSEVTQAERALALVEKERNDAVKKYEQYSNTLHRGIFNMPLLDFAAPKGTGGRNEIQQVVLPDVRVELNFLQSYATDRCMTCHVAIADKNFTKENLARRLETAIGSANEALKKEGGSLLERPVVAGRDDLVEGQVSKGWRTLSKAEQEEFFHSLVEQINVYQARKDLPKLHFGEPLMAHPDLELYISPDSPHPMSKVGCTVCHEGNGEETDFVLAAHMPKTHKERKEWEKKYYVNTAGLVPEISFETAEHHWTRPMLPPKYAEAGCTKCHSQVSDIAVHNGEPAAKNINEGHLLFTTLGCINCHLVEDLGDSRRVGPDLSHVGEKVTQGFMQNWIHFPSDYRPSTNMPHYFLQENNDSGSETAGGDADPVLRTHAEVVAMSEYLQQASNDYHREKPPEDLWDALKDEESEAAVAARERGRQVFGSVGCLACHATLAYQPNDENGAAGESLGQQWIGQDLLGKLDRLVSSVQLGKARKLKKRAIEAAREDGKDITAVNLNDVDKVAEKLAIAAEDAGEDQIPLATVIDIFKGSFDGPRYDAAAARQKTFEAILKATPESLSGIDLSDEERELLERDEAVEEAIATFAQTQFEEMVYVDRVEYAMTNFKNAYDTLFDPKEIDGPVFTRFAPELSSIGTKFENYERAVTWLYDWLKNPRHYSSYTKMPRMRLSRGQFDTLDPETGEPTGEKIDADEALDVAIYLSSLKDNKEFPTTPLNADDAEAKKLADKRDEMIRLLLGGLNSAARSQAILNDEGGELSEQLVLKLTKSLGEQEARGRVEKLDLEQRRWMFLGDKMIGHYGCYACHQIRGYETAARPGTELTYWGEKQLTQLDFAFFEPEFREQRENDPLFKDLYPANREKLIRWAHPNHPEEVDHTLASFAWHKVRNPRLWDRNKAKGPYEKLKMPNFFLSDQQADAIVTFLLSRKPPRVNKNIQVDYDNTPAGKIARGRNLVRELNCVACHKIDDNGAVAHQYFQTADGDELVFDEVNAPPWLRGEGAKIQSDWLYNFLNDVEMLRPWLKVRMPSFHLSQEQSTQLVEYFFGLSQQESIWLAKHLAPVQRYMEEAEKRSQQSAVVVADANAEEGGGDASEEKTADEQAAGADWFQQESLLAVADALRRYAVENRLVPASTADPGETSAEEFADVHAQVFKHAAFLSGVFDVSYPFAEPPVKVSPEEIADGETLFLELKCMACHVFGDPTVPGANAAPTAPNLQLTYERLRRGWVHSWLEGPGRIQPGTKMPNVFGEDRSSAFADYPAEAKAAVLAKLNNKELIDDGPAQMAAIVSFLYDAGKKNLNKIPLPAEPEAEGESEAPTEGATTTEGENAPAASETESPESPEPAPAEGEAVPEASPEENTETSEENEAEEGTVQDEATADQPAAVPAE